MRIKITPSDRGKNIYEYRIIFREMFFFVYIHVIYLMFCIKKTKEMEENKQTLYNDELLNILPDGVIIFNINGEVIQLNHQALTELHVHSSVNEMMPLSTNDLFKLLIIKKIFFLSF